MPLPLCHLVRTEASDICRLMPSPNFTSPAFGQVALSDCLPECKYAIVLTQIVCGHFLRLANRAVMRIVKQQPIVIVSSVVLPDATHKRWVIPFMDDDQVGIAKDFVEV